MSEKVIPWIYTLQRLASSIKYNNNNYNSIKHIDMCYYYNYNNNSIESWTLNEFFDIVLEKYETISDIYDTYSDMNMSSIYIKQFIDNNSSINNYLDASKSKIHFIADGNNQERLNNIKKMTEVLVHNKKYKEHIFISINIKFQAICSSMSTVFNTQKEVDLYHKNTMILGFYENILSIYFLDALGNIKHSHLNEWQSNIDSVENIIEEVSEKQLPLTIILDGDYKDGLYFDKLKNIINSTNVDADNQKLKIIDDFSGRIILNTVSEYSRKKWPRILYYDFEVITNTTTLGKKLNWFLKKLFNSDYGKYIFHQIEFKGTADLSITQQCSSMEVNTIINKIHILLIESLKY